MLGFGPPIDHFEFTPRLFKGRTVFQSAYDESRIPQPLDCVREWERHKDLDFLSRTEHGIEIEVGRQDADHRR